MLSQYGEKQQGKDDCPMCKIGDDALNIIKGDESDGGNKNKKDDNREQKSGFIGKIKKIFIK